MEERRSSPRASIIAIADVTEVSTGTRLSARCSDISRSGCYVDTLNPMPMRTIVSVRIQHQGEELVLTGRIVYISPGLGMGVHFHESITQEQLAVLDRWVAGAT